MLAIVFIIVIIAIMIGSLPFLCLGEEKHSIKHKDTALCSNDLLLYKKSVA